MIPPWKLSLYCTSMALIPLTCILPAQGEESAATAEQQVEQQKTYELEPVTVIATKTPKKLLDAPGSVSVITEEQINAFSAEHPFKVLHLTEGVWARQYRGLADYWARPMVRGRRALMQVDGMNWYDYGYYVDTAAVPMSDLEKVDVVRGPFSALYGTMAQTAVVSYTTRIPEGQEIDASVSFGDWNSRFYSFHFADRPFGKSEEGIDEPSWADRVLGQRFFYSFSFKSRTSDSYVTTPSYKSLSSIDGAADSSIPVVTGWEKDIDPQTGKTRYKIGDQGNNWYEDYGVFIKTGYDFSENTRLWYSLSASKFEYGWEDGTSLLRDSSGNAVYEGDVYIQDGGKTSLVSLSPSLFTSDTKEKESLVHSLHFDHTVPDLLDLTMMVGFNDKEAGTHYESSSRYKAEDSSLTQADLTATFHLLADDLLLTVGTQGVQEEATVTDSNLSNAYDENSIVSTREETNGTNQTLGTFVQAEYSPLDPLTLYLGGRYDHWWGSDADYYSSLSGEYYTQHPDTDDGQFSPKASVVYHPLENGTVRASYGQSFTAPSLYYRTSSYYWEGGGTISMASPNPDLKPETNTSWEVGTEWEFWKKRVRVKLTYFENDFEDMIVSTSTTSTLADGTQVIDKTRINADEAEVNGIEAAVEASFTADLRGGLFYTHNWSEYTVTKDSSKLGWEVDEVPTNIWSAWIGYYFTDNLDLNLSYRYCDSRYDDEYAAYGENSYKGDDEYYVMDAKLTYRPSEHLALSVSVDNLLDEEYYEYYKGPGRFALATLSFSY
ncbi:MAG: TonB-dependent receptor [Candidatus Electrothrix scaldis]|nr:MAG: TonB-dependent receptor [Candidatus Electrothrix sp. GW3-3]